jgi:hypothetical protein
MVCQPVRIKLLVGIPYEMEKATSPLFMDGYASVWGNPKNRVRTHLHVSSRIKLRQVLAIAPGAVAEPIAQQFPTLLTLSFDKPFRS